MEFIIQEDQWQMSGMEGHIEQISLASTSFLSLPAALFIPCLQDLW